MELVSTNSDEEIAVHHAKQDVSWAVQSLTANLMRIVRGAGKSYEVGRQAAALVDACEAYREAAGHYPGPDVIERALHLDNNYPDGLSDSEIERHYAVLTIVDGALQMTASALIGQTTHASIGRNELHDGICSLEDIHQRERQQARAEARASQARRKPKPKPKR